MRTYLEAIYMATAAILGFLMFGPFYQGLVFWLVVIVTLTVVVAFTLGAVFF